MASRTAECRSAPLRSSPRTALVVTHSKSLTRSRSASSSLARAKWMSGLASKTSTRPVMSAEVLELRGQGFDRHLVWPRQVIDGHSPPQQLDGAVGADDPPAECPYCCLAVGWRQRGRLEFFLEADACLEVVGGGRASALEKAMVALSDQLQGHCVGDDR